MSSDPVQVLLQAAADDNISALSQMLSNTTTSTHRESLLLACKRHSINYMTEINRLRPHLACNKDEYGYTVLHLLIIDDELPVSIIEDLIKHHPRGPQLCNETDNQWTTPIHMATKQGRIDQLKVLIRACGIDSLSRVTSLHQTAFHLALENGQIGCFDVMMEELLKRDDEQLSKSLQVLSMKDHNGNTVLHIAVAKKQTYISGYLLADNPKGRPLVEVGMKNNSGLTALQIYEQNSPERDDRRIGEFLIRAGPHDQMNVVSPMEISHNNSETSKMTSLTAKSLIMAAMAVFAAVAFGSLSVYRSIFTAGTQPVPPNANLFTILLLPSGFLYLTFATVTFVVCMWVILVLLWSINFQYWSTFGRPIFLFLWAAIQTLFGLAVKELMPDFAVTTFGAHRISSLRLLGFYMAAILLSFFTFVFIVKLIIVNVSKVCAYLVEEF